MLDILLSHSNNRIVLPSTIIVVSSSSGEMDSDTAELLNTVNSKE
jgi:hypothetical protein